jgi:hypothetical protein
MFIILTLVLLSTPALGQPRLSEAVETPVPGGRQLKGLLTIDSQGKPVTKRFVIRTPDKWNG